MYRITYADSVSGDMCGATNFNASSCGDGHCQYTFDVTKSSLPCHSSINVTVSASVSNTTVTTTIGRRFPMILLIFRKVYNTLILLQML